MWSNKPIVNPNERQHSLQFRRFWRRLAWQAWLLGEPLRWRDLAPQQRTRQKMRQILRSTELGLNDQCVVYCVVGSRFLSGSPKNVTGQIILRPNRPNYKVWASKSKSRTKWCNEAAPLFGYYYFNWRVKRRYLNNLKQPSSFLLAAYFENPVPNHFITILRRHFVRSLVFSLSLQVLLK